MPTEDTTVEVTYRDLHEAAQHCVDNASDADEMADPDYVAGLVDGIRALEGELCLRLGLDRHD